MKGGRVEGEKVRRLKRRLKASIPGMQTTFYQLHDIRHFTAFTAGLVQLKKPSGGPKGLIGPPCHGAPGCRRQRMKYISTIFFMVLLVININLFSQKEKKIGLEFSVGVARVDPVSIYQRFPGIDELIHQYAQHYQVDYSATGGFAESKLLIPFVGFSVNYRLNKNLHLKAGVDYSFSGSNSSEKSSRVTWSNFYEQYDYQLTNKISYLLPHIGLGVGSGSFDFHCALGMGFTRFTYIEGLHYSESEPEYSYDREDTFKVKGTAPGVIVGIKYSLPLGKKSAGKGLKAFIKLEAVLLKVNSLSGTRTTTASDSQGERFSQTQEGTLYEFEWNPYGRQRFAFWDLYDTLPDDPTMRGFNKMGINLSGIRLMIGISF
jgi:hypothetical protein